MSSNTEDNAPLSSIALLESLLFVADGPAPASRLADTLGISIDAVNVLIGELEESYADRGLRIQWGRQNTVQLTTAPAAAGALERFLGLETAARLSPAALEALAIVAYQQPVMRSEVDAIRGVNSDGVMRTLVNKGLIEEIGRAEKPGRPILYGTTPSFLQHFGLSSLDELPELDVFGELSPPENE